MVRFIYEPLHGYVRETRSKTREISATAVLTATVIKNNINRRVRLELLNFYYLEEGLMFFIIMVFLFGATPPEALIEKE